MPSASFANAIVVLYAVSALLGAVVYLPFRIDIRPDLERAGHWQALGLFDLKEHFVAIGLALLPAYWVCWRRPACRRARPERAAALTLILAFIVWWSFLIGHVLNNIMGFGSMTSSPPFRRFAFAYGSAFAILYVIALKLDLALFTVYPTIGVVLLGTHHSRDTVGPSMGSFLPAMHWYGWTATAALGALIFGLGAALLPERWTRPLWSGWLWVTAVAGMIGCVYLTLPWFRL